MLSRKRRTTFTPLLVAPGTRFEGGSMISSSEILACLTKYCLAEPHVATTASATGRKMLPVEGKDTVLEFLRM
jgi:hypothetical protein